MRSPLSTSAAVTAVGVLLLTACGTQSAGSQHGTSPRPEAAPYAEKDGVKVTDWNPDTQRAEFEATNRESEPSTYTVGFALRTDSGEGLGEARQTVSAVKPGQTVKSSVTVSDLHGLPSRAHRVAHVKIARVRSVPTAEDSSSGGTCPPSGVRVYADEGDAAMGLRVIGLHLENCGTQTRRLNGYPNVQLLDEAHKPVDGVKVLQGGSSIATGTGADGVPQPLALKPGERAYAGLVWRNTVEAGVGDPVNAPYVRVRANPGDAPMMVIPELDLGTTGKVGVGPWKRDSGR
ncbi:DUF4232 domain-containing protein [Streptomyces sp. CBMA152]|uniref:DUF4232 domain-containing protein n=1 Tax=Streptomyces sp. CBMA152 TaxID=1896312 RepID=UPI0016601418|nr:DUF4232 domain-containing protein [Streptomyces sp. CBMA152]MBD0741226.1 hypothetical protein [Streptomyces sp. CBMA152]